MKVKDLKIGNYYFVEGVGVGRYLGRLNYEYVDERDRSKGWRMFKILNLKTDWALKLSKKDVVESVCEDY